jgi:phosphoglycolate phosphatase
VSLLIFDLDGTLIDSRLDLAYSVNATRAHAGMGPIDPELVYSYVGNGAPMLIRRALPGAGEAEIAHALGYFIEYYRDHALDHTVLYPGVRESLARMHDE